MNCQDFHARLHAYYLGTLTVKQRHELVVHAAECTECGKLFALCQELSCREFVEFLDDYVAEVLPPERRDAFERHIAICSECTNYLDGYRKALDATQRVLSGDEEPAPQAPLPEDLIRAILASRSS